MMLGKLTLAILVSLSLATTLGGCGTDPDRPQLGKVRGKVTYKGKPVTTGRVTFTPVSGEAAKFGRVASGPIESDGSYTLTTFDTGDGAPVGQHTVTVESRPGDLTALNKPEKPGVGVRLKYVVPKSVLPARYGDVRTSPERRTVEPGNNEINLDLKD